MAANLAKLDPKTLNIGILGYTGETGKVLTREIYKNNIFKSARLIGRRVVNYDEEYLKNATQKVIDFDKINEYDEAFKDLDVIYCCLGTTRGKAGADGFKKVDYDYIVDSAKMAKKNGCKQFHLVSSAGADKNSMFLYPKIKGLSEETIGGLGFEKAAMYRPKLLLGDREEKRTGESILKYIVRPIANISPTLFSTPLDTLSKSMIANTIYKQPNEESVDIVDNARIFKLAELYDQEGAK